MRGKYAAIWVVVGVWAALLGGCSHPVEDPTTKEPGKPTTAPNDSGGFAKDMAEPPAKNADVNVDEDVKLGKSTDTREKTPAELDPELAKKQAEEAAKAAAAKKEVVKEKDTSGDGKYKDSSKPVIAVQTRYGVFYAELWPAVAPKTVKAILGLVRKGFYDGIYVHRVEPGFVVQAGDPLTKEGGPHARGVGSGGPGFTIPAEFSDKPHDRGTLSMARGPDKDSAGSQFFICLTREGCKALDGKYTVFGHVQDDAMTNVDQIKVGDLLQHVWIVKDLPEDKR